MIADALRRRAQFQLARQFASLPKSPPENVTHAAVTFTINRVNVLQVVSFYYLFKYLLFFHKLSGHAHSQRTSKLDGVIDN